MTKNQHDKITINIYNKHNKEALVTLLSVFIRFKYREGSMIYAQ
ncbi:hypothetical protein [Photobacterium carnosum]|nr:hypothetical protein [Photobacterium carnosum]